MTDSLRAQQFRQKLQNEAQVDFCRALGSSLPYLVISRPGRPPRRPKRSHLRAVKITLSRYDRKRPGVQRLLEGYAGRTRQLL